MPRKPKRPCSFPGCPKLTEGRFCEEHERQENRRYEKYDRDPAVRRRYGRAWKRIRDRYAAKHPFCEECQKKGLLRPVEEVHHKLPLAEGGTHDVVFQIKRAANLQIILAPYKIDVVLQPHYPETLLHITRTKILPCKLIAQEYSVSSYENGSSFSSIWQA